MHTLYTLGYTGIQPQEIADAAQRAGAVIADIRISPRSRHPQWDGETLKKVWGSSYVHIPQLGNKNYKGDYGVGIMLAKPDSGAQLVQVWLNRMPVILLCACEHWMTCHRRNAAEYIAARNPGLEVVHLTHETLRALGHPMQFSLF